ncbi:MAG: hypothetical protein KTR35_09570 [Gammaproteobacteria bacterium]|nr:hypothetical protein [Gammaproteobacteria bacterium]
MGRTVVESKLLNRLSIGAVMSGSLWLWAGPAAGETVITDDYVYIGVEAEDYTVKDDRWVYTDSSTGENPDDPDGNHSDGASGGVYFELLPDIRVTHSDPMGPPTAYWGAPGTGPEMHWPITIPEAGRYYVFVRAFSTGTEDNGIHIGKDGQWPQSGRRLQFCTAGNGWSWSSAQRDSGGNGSCGKQHTIYLDFDSAGNYTLQVSAREDGFELDRLVLLKDLSGNTKTCKPVNEDGVNCTNGGIETPDDFIDLFTQIEAGTTEVGVGQSVSVTITLENLDSFDTANNIEVVVPLEANWAVETNDEHCSIANGDLVCELAELEPTAPHEMEAFDVVLQATSTGSLTLSATASADEADEDASNDSASLTFTVSDTSTTTDVTLNVTTSATSALENEPFTTVLTALNSGELTATDVSVSMGLPMGVSVYSLPTNCQMTTHIECELGDIDADGSVSAEIQLLAANSATLTLPAAVFAGNDADTNNNVDSDSIIISAPIESTTGGSGGTTDGGSDEDAGRASYWLLLMLGLFGLARVYRGHQHRVPVLIRKR